MQQVILRLPIYTRWTENGVPIYGFGLMLFFAFIACSWLAGRRAVRVGMTKEIIQDFTIWVFLGGLLGARVFYLYGEKETPPANVVEFLTELPKIWEGGIIFYGSIVGALAAYTLAYYISFRKQGVSTLKLADVVAPSLALGLALGRIGCFLNGCCYGQAACADCPVYPVHFPLSAPARYALVESGMQTAAGFTVDESYHGPGVRVAQVDPNYPELASKLKPGDVLEEADGKKLAPPIEKGTVDLSKYLGNFNDWPRGKTDLTLKVQGEEPFTVRPRTIGLHPTQLYETISMVIVIFLLLAYEPFKTRDGQVMVLMMLAYAVHRFINEMLRNDPRPVGFERYASVFVFGAALLLALWLWSRPAQYKPSWTVPAPA